MKKKRNSYSAEFKQEAVRRMAQATTITGLAKGDEGTAYLLQQFAGIRTLSPYLPQPSIHMCTARSSAPRLAAVTSRLALCRDRFRAHTLSPAHRSRSSSRTQEGGRTRCAMQMWMSS